MSEKHVELGVNVVVSGLVLERRSSRETPSSEDAAGTMKKIERRRVGSWEKALFRSSPVLIILDV